MKRLKTAVVGVGSLGRHHLRWFSQIPQSELIGLFDTDKDRASKYASEYNIKSFGSLEELAGQVEAVSIVVPTTAHFDVASTLIEHGIHCLIEKPISATVEQAQKLHELAKQKNVKVTVGHIERFNPAVIALKEYNIKPAFVEAHRLAAFDPRGTDVAVILDLMIHDIDLVLSLVKQQVVDIQASAVAVVSEQADIANARITFDNGAVANLTASRISLRAMRKLRLFQHSGYYSLDLAQKQADVYLLAEPGVTGAGMRVPLGKSGKDILYLQKPDNGKDMLGTELETFLDAILNNAQVAVTIQEGAEALRVALEVERIGTSSIAKMLSGEK